MATVEVLERVNGWATQDLAKTISDVEGHLGSGRNGNFGVLYGRDAAIASEFSLDIFEKHPEKIELLSPVKNSLITMVLNQGQVVNNPRDEQPGKIHHEKRDEKALIGIPEAYQKNQEILDNMQADNWPVIGERGQRTVCVFFSIDATALFGALSSRYLLLTKDREFFEFLDPHIRKAITWMEVYGDTYGDGYIRFSNKNRHGLINEGWMDSYDSIEISPGKRPKEPIALVEVQGYAYEAYILTAELYRNSGDIEYAKHLYQRAGILKERLNADFWMEDERFFAQALSADNEQVHDIVSNVGHLLATGIVDDKKVPDVVHRLMQPDMLTPWGIRTRSLNSPNFSDVEPTAYHRGGTVWPHDNGMIARGLRMVGFQEEAALIEDRLLSAEIILKYTYGISSEELFIVDRNNRLRPYATGQKPQGWAAAAYKAITTI